MTLAVERFGDVTRLRMSTASTRIARLDVSAYVLRGVMIDSGFHRVRAQLTAAVGSLGVRGAIITHWHEDHAGNVPALAAMGLPLLLRDDTDAILRAHPSIGLYRRFTWGHPARFTQTLMPFDPDGFERIHTPGHSVDHQVVWDASTGTLFSGDLWLGVHARILHASEDPYQIIQSLHIARALRPERMFDAHRGFVATPAAAIDARIQWLGETLALVEEQLRAGWSVDRILKETLGGEERAGYISGGDYSRRNFVLAVEKKMRS